MRAGGLFALSLVLCAQASPTSLRVADGEAPPEFIVDVGAGPETLPSLAGRAVIVHFWASWCRPCLKELPLLARAKDVYGDRVVVITLPWKEPVSTTRAFLEDQKFDLAVVADPGQTIADRYGIAAIPTTVVVGPDGLVTHVSVGVTDWEELHEALEAALASPQTLTPQPRSDTVMQSSGTH
ncbi:MAG TPA: TlpA disulfide reductase family protein [Candidatus Baltobacteraceae bacterium]